MNLTEFFPSQKPRVSLKTALKRMRSTWLCGNVSNFDLKLARILDCNLDKAVNVRNSWIEMGFLCFNKQGLLTWKNGVF